MYDGSFQRGLFGCTSKLTGFPMFIFHFSELQLGSTYRETKRDIIIDDGEDICHSREATRPTADGNTITLMNVARINTLIVISNRHRLLQVGLEFSEDPSKGCRNFDPSEFNCKSKMQTHC